MFFHNSNSPIPKIKFFLFFLLLPSLGHSESLDLPIYDYRPTDKAYTFQIKSNKAVNKILLDCQSFLNGITFYQKNHPKYPAPSFHFYLYAKECREVHRFISEQMNRGEQACIRLYTKEKDFALYSNENCR